MSGYVPNPLIVQALEQSHHEHLSIFLTGDTNYQAEVISQTVQRNLSKGSHTYIIIPDDSLILPVKQLLSKYSLAHLSQSKSSIEKPAKDIIENAQTLEKLRAILQAPNTLESAYESKQASLSKIKKELAFYHKPVDSYQTVKEYAVSEQNQKLNQISTQLSGELLAADFDQESSQKYTVLGELYQDYFTLLTYDKIDCSIFDSEEKVELFKQNINALKSSLENINKELNEFINRHDITTESLSRLTPFNVDNVTNQLSDSLADIRTMAQKAPYLAHVPKKRYFNISLLIKDIGELNEKVDHLITLIENERLVNYRLLQRELQCSDELIDALSTSSEPDWGETYLKLLLSAQAEQKANFSQALKAEQLNYLKTCATIERIKSQTTHNLWSTRRINALNNSSIDTLQNLHSTDHSLTKGNEELQTVLNEFYPIQIMNIDELYDCDLAALKSDSTILFYHIKKVSSKVLSNIQGPIESIILSPEIHNIQELQDNFSTQILKLDHTRILEAQPFELLQAIDRLKQAQALAYAIYMISDRFDVVQLKHKSVISLSSKTISNQIISALPQESVNILYQDSSAYEDLIDAMIHEDRSISIIVENGLIDERRLDHLQWQLHIMNLIEQAQVDLIDIPTHQLIIDYKSTMSAVINRILAPSTSKEVLSPILQHEPQAIPIQNQV